MRRLYEIGFQPVGKWFLNGEELGLELNHLVEHQNVLYAFISNDAVKYVGKTTQTLQRRMFGYQKPNESQRTNWRNRQAILDLLKRGSPVEILAMADAGLLRYGAFHLSLAAGLEDSIIKILDPEWNGGRSSTLIEAPEEANPPETSKEAKLEAEAVSGAKSFPLTLQETYYRRGFFNVPVPYSTLFGGDKARITIYCGPEKLVVNGEINRTANTNGTPRIMGGVPLREWFQKREQMDIVTVTVLGPTTIAIL
jgi:hypothetical protein